MRRNFRRIFPVPLLQLDNTLSETYETIVVAVSFRAFCIRRTAPCREIGRTEGVFVPTVRFPSVLVGQAESGVFARAVG